MDKIEEIVTLMDIDLKKKDVFFVWQLDDQFKIVNISEGVEKILGYKVQDVLNSDFTEYMLKQEGRYFIKELKDYYGSIKNDFNITTIFKRKDKTHVVLETRGKTVFMNKSKISGYEGLTFYR
jgi:PAS domain S-box-containing protein